MFEYIVVIASIIIGLALTHLMQGTAALVQNPKRGEVWWVHLVWVAHMFVSAVFWWWSEFRLRNVQHWTFNLYVLVLTYAFILYLASALLFPRNMEGYDGFKDYFLSRRRWFFGLLIGWVGIDFFDTALKGMAYFHSLGWEYPVAQVTLSVLAAAGFISRREGVQGAIAIAYFAYQLSWV